MDDRAASSVGFAAPGCPPSAGNRMPNSFPVMQHPKDRSKEDPVSLPRFGEGEPRQRWMRFPVPRLTASSLISIERNTGDVSPYSPSVIGGPAHHSYTVPCALYDGQFRRSVHPRLMIKAEKSIKDHAVPLSLRKKICKIRLRGGKRADHKNRSLCRCWKRLDTDSCVTAITQPCISPGYRKTGHPFAG